MTRHVWMCGSAVAGFSLLLAACVSGTQTAVPLPGDALVATAAVQTFAAQLTLTTGQTAVSALTQISRPGPAVSTPTPFEPPPGSPTPTPLPPTSTPTPTPVPQPCNLAQLIANITINDGTLIQPGTSFTKTWRVKNIGSCTWTPGYSLTFASGEKMDGPDSLSLPPNVLPGQTVDVSIDLIAPDTPGLYTSYWELRDASGGLFGTDGNPISPLWVKIKVGKTLKIAYEFISILCAADWEMNGTRELDCQNQGYDIIDGFVILQPDPILENGATADRPAIVTYPGQMIGSTISGRYPAFQVNDGDRFRTAIGCLYESLSCNVVFMLNYRINDGPIQNLGTWFETYTNHYRSLDIDLSPLAGHSVEFILTVINNGSLTDNWAFWLMPAIYR